MRQTTGIRKRPSEKIPTEIKWLALPGSRYKISMGGVRIIDLNRSEEKTGSLWAASEAMPVPNEAVWPQKLTCQHRFKVLNSAAAVLSGIEVAHIIRKPQKDCLDSKVPSRGRIID